MRCLTGSLRELRDADAAEIAAIFAREAALVEVLARTPATPESLPEEADS